MEVNLHHQSIRSKTTDSIKGHVIWLMGLSGAGKSTLGQRVHDWMKTRHRSVSFLDGDLVRDFFENDLGYSKEDRFQNVKRILLSAFMLSENGIDVVVCNTHPFESLRSLARRQIQNYHEIYLDRSFESCMRIDPKGIYKKHLNKTPLIGREIEFDVPKRADLKLSIESQSVDESFRMIQQYLRAKVTHL